MNKDENKFSLVVYEKGNINNRKVLIYTGNLKVKSGKSRLSLIDNYTSKYTQKELYDQLLEKGVITKEQTEFVIWFMQKDVIQQIPVIFNDEVIRNYTTYLNLKDEEKQPEWKDAFDKLNEKTSYIFLSRVKEDSEKYDKLSEEDKKTFMEKDSFSAKFVRMPFALSTFKKRVNDRIVGVYQDKDNPRVKKGTNYSHNFGNIKKDISTSYRCFRDVYLYLEKKSNFETTHIDLDPSKISEQQVSTNQKKEQLKEIKDEILKLNNDDKKTIYFESDFIELARDNEFNDFVWNSELVTKKVKDATNSINKSFFDSEVDTSLQAIILEFSDKHPGVINQLIHQYKESQKRL